MPTHHHHCPRPRHRHALAAAVLAACCCCALPAAAQTAAFDIPAQPLSAALRQFAGQSGVQIVFAPGLGEGRTSRPVRGTLDAEAALRQLLQGSWLELRRDGATWTVAPAAASGGSLKEVTVTAEAERAGGLPGPYAGGQVARGGRVGMLGNLDVMETPFNLTSYTSELIENQQARSVGDVLANDPSVRSATTAGAPGEYLLIRGFPAIEDSTFFNGLAGMAPNNRSSTEMVERAEVLKGPSAAISGMVPDGSIGGTVMLVPKRATDEPLTRIGLDYATRSQFGTRVDLGRRFGENKAWGIRVNGVLRNGEGYAQGRDQRMGLTSVALDYRGERLRMALDAYDQNDSEMAALTTSSFLTASPPPSPMHRNP